MKKLLPFLAISILFIFSSQIFAQDATSSTAKREQLLNKKAAQIAPKLTDDRLQKIASKTAELKTKLQNFKNKVKADTAQRVNDNLNRINSNRVAEMSGNIQKMNNILAKLEALPGATSASAQIASAGAAIAAAQSAVTAQSQKNYTIQITTEATVRADVKKMRDQLMTDLQADRKLIVDAKKALVNAVAAVRPAKGEKEKNGQ